MTEDPAFEGLMSEEQPCTVATLLAEFYARYPHSLGAHELDQRARECDCFSCVRAMKAAGIEVEP